MHTSSGVGCKRPAAPGTIVSLKYRLLSVTLLPRKLCISNQRLQMGVGDRGKCLHLPTPSLRMKIINSSAPISESATSGRRLPPVLPHPLQRDFSSGLIHSRTFEASSFISSQCAFPSSCLPCVSQIAEAGTVGQAFLTTRDTICLLRNSPLQMEPHRGRILAITSPLPGFMGM